MSLVDSLNRKSESFVFQELINSQSQCKFYFLCFWLLFLMSRVSLSLILICFYFYFCFPRISYCFLLLFCLCLLIFLLDAADKSAPKSPGYLRSTLSRTLTYTNALGSPKSMSQSQKFLKSKQAQEQSPRKVSPGRGEIQSKFKNSTCFTFGITSTSRDSNSPLKGSLGSSGVPRMQEVDSSLLPQVIY